MKPIILSSPEDAGSAAKAILKQYKDSRKFALKGDMGAGKTTLIQAICKELKVKEVVTSPTFALVNEYFTPEGDSVFHFDLYRIEDISELYDIGYEDYFYSDAWVFVEWPEKAPELIPEDFQMLTISIQQDGARHISGNN